MHRGTINAAEQSLNFNNLNEGWYIFFDEGNVATNKPLDVASFGVVLNQDLGSSKIQICYVATYANSPRRYYLASRIYSIESGNWNTWRRTQLDTTDFPSFYKNYNDIPSLAAAQGIIRFTIEAGASYTIGRDSFVVLDYDSGSQIGIFCNRWNGIVDVIPNTFATCSTSANSVTITNSSPKVIYGMAIYLRIW